MARIMPCRNRALGTWWRSSRRQQLVGEGGPHLTTGLVRSRDGMRAPHLGALVSPQDAAMTTFLRALAKSLMRSSPDGDSLRLRHACRRKDNLRCGAEYQAGELAACTCPPAQKGCRGCFAARRHRHSKPWRSVPEYRMI